MPINYRPIVLIIALGFGLLPSVAIALSYTMMSDDQLLNQSSLVVTATVTGRLQEPAFSPNNHQRTLYQVQIREVFKGQAAGDTLTVAILGKPLGEAGLYAPGSPHLQQDQPLLLFLTSNEDGIWRPVQLVFGVFPEHQVGSQRIYLRDLDRHPDTTAKDRHAAYAAPRDADGFEAWLQGQKTSPDYLIPALAQAKFLIASGGSNPVRWFAFDDGLNEDWFAIATGQAGASYDEFAAVESAIAAWNGVSGGNIRLNYAGTVPSADISTINGPSVVIWDDPDDVIAGAWSNGGTLAIGSFIATNPEIFNGVAYFRILRAYVITQNGAVSYFNDDNGRNGAEVLTHEIGHGLGFAHPCSDNDCTSLEKDATMRARVHGDGRGAALAVDDIAAVRFLYPLTDSLLYRDGFESP